MRGDRCRGGAGCGDWAGGGGWFFEFDFPGFFLWLPAGSAGEVVGPGGVFFADTAVAVEVGVAAVGEDLGEAVVKVRGVAGGG